MPVRSTNITHYRNTGSSFVQVCPPLLNRNYPDCPSGKMDYNRGPAKNRWSVFPAWLADGRLAWIDAAPGYPDQGNEYAIHMQSAVIDGKPVLEQDLIVEWPAWAPDGSSLAYLARSSGAGTPWDAIRWLKW